MRLHLPWLVVVLILPGCSGLQAKNRMEQYDRVARSYEKALMWSEFEVAYSATKAARTSPRLPDASQYTDIKITSYDPASPQASKDSMTINRIARVRYVHLSRMAELSLVTEEEWKYSDEDGRWYLMSGFPKFK